MKESSRKVFTLKLINRNFECLGIVSNDDEEDVFCKTVFSEGTSNTTIMNHCFNHRNLKQVIQDDRDNLPSIANKGCKRVNDIPLINEDAPAKRSATTIFSKINTSTPFSISHKQSLSKKLFLTSAISNLVIGASLSYSIVDNPAFVELIEKISNFSKEDIPSRNTIVSSINKEANDLTSRMIDVLKDQKFALSFDEWSRKELQVIIIVVFWKGNSRILGLQEISTSTKSIDIKNDIELIVDKFKLNMDNCLGITSDGASNVNRTIKLFEKSRIWCFSHVMSLICKDTCKASSSIQTFISKIRKEVNKLKAPKKYRESPLAQSKLKLRTDVDIRWYSTVQMMSSIVNACHKTNNLFEFTELEIKCMKFLIKLLSPFKKFILIAQTKSVIHYIELFHNLIREIESIPDFQIDENLSSSEEFPQLLNLNQKETSVIIEEENYLDSESESDNSEDDLWSDSSSIIDGPTIGYSNIESELKIYRCNLILNAKKRLMYALNDFTLMNASYCNPRLAYHKDVSNYDGWSVVEERLGLKENNQINQRNNISSRCFEPAVTKSDCVAQYKASLNDDIQSIEEFYKINGFRFEKIDKHYRDYEIIPCTSIRSESGFSRLGFTRSSRRQRLTTTNISNLLFLNDHLIQSRK
uniref:Dimer_Tnp_hAT domain-containing protein n=1 Tax=Rhabditophanes sp. KR3021 TaxID=114890 RepID=A0AC35TTY5_9BILA